MLNLGTKKHRDKYYEGIDNLEYTGCFAMTELHHGMLFLWPLLFFVSCVCVCVPPSFFLLIGFHYFGHLNHLFILCTLLEF